MCQPFLGRHIIRADVAHVCFIFLPDAWTRQIMTISHSLSIGYMSTNGAWTSCGHAWTRGRAVSRRQAKTFFRKSARQRDKMGLSIVLSIVCVSRSVSGTRPRQTKVLLMQNRSKMPVKLPTASSLAMKNGNRTIADGLT